MKIYYYHTRPIKEAIAEWKRGEHPGHILYGVTHFERHGVETVLHRYKTQKSRLRLMLYNLWAVLTCGETYDLFYATSYRGIEPLIFLRALGLYRKPIVIWHHTAVQRPSSLLKRMVSRLFYRGIDHLFLFSRRLIADSEKSGMVKSSRLQLVHWGADLEFYDRIMSEKLPQEYQFISTGKENRDFKTLLQGFSQVPEARLQLFTSRSNGDQHYDRLFDEIQRPTNVSLQLVSGIIPLQLAREVAKSQAVVISCLRFPYTVGLTTLVEAMALGLPLICTRNPYFEMDIDAEQIGITVDYDDAEGWEKAIRRLTESPEEARRLGANSRHLAERTYNLENFAAEIVEGFSKVLSSHR